MSADTPDPLLDEIKQLAVELARTDQEDVRDSADQFCREYSRTVRMVNALFEIDLMTQEGKEGELELRRQERLTNAREQLRDRLRRLLAWGRETGRLCG